MSQPVNLTREARIHLFRTTGGLKLFENGGNGYRIPIPEQPPLPMFTEQDAWLFEVTAPVADFYLKMTLLEEGPWAYVASGGHVIVPPFEWHGREFLSSVIW